VSCREREDVPVARLRAIRVLLVGRDQRFLRMADMLLRRHGCEVASIERPSELLDRVERQRPNVVVLDGSESVSATARAVAALEALALPVSTVIVYEGAQDDPLRQLRLLPKWAGFDEIVSEVERVYAGDCSPQGGPEQRPS
jgi:CheY-like chemotaxis protein